MNAGSSLITPSPFSSLREGGIRKRHATTSSIKDKPMVPSLFDQIVRSQQGILSPLSLWRVCTAVQHAVRSPYYSRAGIVEKQLTCITMDPHRRPLGLIDPLGCLARHTCPRVEDAGRQRGQMKSFQEGMTSHTIVGCNRAERHAKAESVEGKVLPLLSKY